jgi:hypothetical protein
MIDTSTSGIEHSCYLLPQGRHTPNWLALDCVEPSCSHPGPVSAASQTFWDMQCILPVSFTGEKMRWKKPDGFSKLQVMMNDPQVAKCGAQRSLRTHLPPGAAQVHRATHKWQNGCPLWRPEMHLLSTSGWHGKHRWTTHSPCVLLDES